VCRNYTSRAYYRPDDQAQQKAHLENTAIPAANAWMSQQIVCFYFQSQQRSYMVNKHNVDNPSAPIVIDSDNEDPLSSDDDDCHCDAPPTRPRKRARK